MLRTFIALLMTPVGLIAGVLTQPIEYSEDGVTHRGVVAYPENQDPCPGILMVPNWMGPTEASLEKAKQIAASGYVVLMADVYGTDVRPTSASEAGEAAGFLRGDRPLMRARAARALQSLMDAPDEVPLDRNRVAAIGFCFGGGTVLELARTGVDLDAVVSFHGDLMSPTLEPYAGKTKAAVLVLHGADDPFVPQSDVQAFIEVMQTTSADWQLVQFSGTVHSFTDPNAAMTGKAEYHPRSAKRAFEMMDDLFDELWVADSER